MKERKLMASNTSTGNSLSAIFRELYDVDPENRYRTEFGHENWEALKKTKLFDVVEFDLPPRISIKDAIYTNNPFLKLIK